MLKAKTFDIKTTNMALFGTDLEKNIKKASAETEQAWTGAGSEVGILIWRIENFKVVPWPKENYGKFYSGDSYIVLNTYKKEDKLLHDVHFWIGSGSTQDEYGTAAYKTVELDNFLDGLPVQHREIEGYQSNLFMSYFKEFYVLDGGVESGFNHVKPTEYKPRLLHIKGPGKCVAVIQVEPKPESLNSGDVFILDMGLDLYQMNGDSAGPFEKNKAAQLCRALDDERGGKPEVHVFGQDDHDKDAMVFWNFVGCKGKDVGPPIPDEKVPSSKSLHRISFNDGKWSFSKCDEVSKASLASDDVFVLDSGYEIFVWTGASANNMEKKNGLSIATDYLFKEDKMLYTPLTAVLEGAENDAFFAALSA